ncbi:P-loop containing nucleoside triphosphate hydrolase protein [Baffinella frigidus]|nr:P-loop containing nucleoside triphosphate hydrolase protein [Cryptophyta sp. CCMP2293]|mmetsp:Transcript_53212/g.126660  ORF Transcript_53212/g.126660 Transcript_53212/m.126660 type:complete len:329 (+) Transcript_53212:3-989(+)
MLSSKGAAHMPWVEKYRPQTLSDVVGNVDAVSRLQRIAEDGNMPHMILTGSPGIGKTTCVLALAREILGSSVKEGVLELNASDERGIDVVRNKIKMFAQQKVTLPQGKHKIVILDEADSMTTAAQQAMRRTMELYSNTTRFALACNNSSEIIEPIQSRCAILRFTRLQDAELLERLEDICKKEEIKYTMDGLEAIIFTADGDLRQAINALQSTAAGFDLVDQVSVFKVCDQPHPKKAMDIVRSCMAGEVHEAHQRLEELWAKGYSAQDIIQTLSRVTRSMEMPEKTKLDFLQVLGTVHMRILDGTDSLLQLSGLIGTLSLLKHTAGAA